MKWTKSCKNCLMEKPINEFSTQKSRGKEYVNNVCIVCTKQQQKEYRENNKEAKRQRDKEYYERVKSTPDFIEKGLLYRHSKKERKKVYDRVYRKTHQDQIRQYCNDNRDAIAQMRHDYHLRHKEDRSKYNKTWVSSNRKKKRKYNTAYILRRMKRDISFRLRQNFSKAINKHLKSLGSSKNGNSILQFLSYSIFELKDYLEQQFEPWMSWNNWGKYNVQTWDDNDQTTWTWQIDHIIPQSKFPYSSMEDDTFKQCWSLDNLRPYSSKQNLLDGARIEANRR